MSARGLEIELARLYADPKYLAAFLENPERALEQADLDAVERKALVEIERAGLVMAANSYAAKRKAYTRRKKPPTFLVLLFKKLKRLLIGS
jgi:hypothetical protein